MEKRIHKQDDFAILPGTVLQRSAFIRRAGRLAFYEHRRFPLTMPAYYSGSYSQTKNPMTDIKNRIAMAGALLLLGWIAPIPPAQAQFVHPGGLHTQADFDRMAAKVAAGEQPWTATYDKLVADRHAQLSWTPAPVAVLCRTGNQSICRNNYTRSQEDAQAIYDLAIRYRVSGDTRYADKAITIMDAWSRTLTGITGDSNQSLGAGICGYLFAIAGEALRGYGGWSAASQTAYANLLVNVFYAKNHDFLVRHHGTCASHYRLNWETCNMAAMIAIGVFADRQDIFDEAATYFKSGIGNGNITRAAWYIHPDGLAQTEEAGRDQPHNLGGWDSLCMMAEIAWNQGEDLYGYDNNRLLRGLEYIAKYNLGYDVPYVPYLNCDLATERVISGSGRGARNPQAWERAYNHYVNRMGLAAPYIARYAALLRPDGVPNNYGTHPSRFDWLGIGSLTFYRDPIPYGAAPSGLVAKVSGRQVGLTWWGSAYAKGYHVKRATTRGGPYTTIATVTDTHYVDTMVSDKAIYYYVISVQSSSGESTDSAEAAAIVGPWLWAYLPFDEACGATASDASGNGWDGTLINGPTWVPGYVGNAVSLNGVGQYVSLPAGVISNLNDFTITMWVNLDSVRTWSRIFDFGMDRERYMYLTPRRSSTPATLSFAITTAGSRAEERIDGPAPLSEGWHHVAVTLAGADQTGLGILYVDGVEVGRNSTMFHTPGILGDLGNTTNNWIGRSQYNDPYLDGLVDEFRIYSGALTAAEIAALAAGTP